MSGVRGVWGIELWTITDGERAEPSSISATATVT